MELQALNAYVPENTQATRARLDDIRRLLQSTATLNAGEAFDSWFDTYPPPTEKELQGVRSERQKFSDAGIEWKGHRTVRLCAHICTQDRAALSGYSVTHRSGHVEACDRESGALGGTKT